MALIGDILFRDDPYKELDEIKRKRLDRVGNSIMNDAIDEIPEISESDFVEKTMNQFGLNVPSFDYDSLKKDKQGPPGGERLVIKLKVEGNVELLGYPPSEDESFEVEVDNIDGNWVMWRISLDDKTGEEASDEIEEELERAQEGLDALQPRLEQVNESLRERAKEEYNERLEKSKSHSETLENIDFTTPDDESE